jgi:hypothetical protein
MSPSGQRHWPSSSSTNEQLRISGGGTVASIDGVPFAGLINVTVVLAGPCRVWPWGMGVVPAKNGKLEINGL